MMIPASLADRHSSMQFWSSKKVLRAIPNRSVTNSGTTFTGNSNCNFNAGIYVLAGGGFTSHRTPTITGTGVMIYLTNGASWDCSGNDTVNFTAPSPSNCAACPSQYDGIVIYQDSKDTNDPKFGGNVGSTFGGAIYFPSAQITFKGNPSGIAF